MIDQVITSRQFNLGLVLIFLGFAGVLVVLAVLDRDIGLVVAACLPFLLGVAVLYSRQMIFELTADAIVVHNPPQSIPYSTLETLVARKRPANPKKPHPRHFPIAVVHQAGTLHLPAHLSKPSDEVFDFLLETFPPENLSPVNPLLEDYLQEQLGTFGAERVWAYSARSNLGTLNPPRGFRIWGMLLLTGVLWMIAGPATGEYAWLAVGMFLFLGAVAGMVLSQLLARRPVARVKKWRESSLVISPLGMALVQGDLKGEMRWDELIDVKFNPSQFFALSGDVIGWGILLIFEGAHVKIADVYNRPLYLIYQQIRAYWRRA